MNDLELLASLNPVNDGDLVIDPDEALLNEITAIERPHRFGRRVGGAVAVAAALTAVIGAPMALGGHDRTAPRATGEPSAKEAIRVVTPRLRFTAAAIRIAQHNPRVLVTAPGWKVRQLGGFSATSGEMGFQYGPDKWHDSPMYGTDGHLAGYSHLNLAPSLEVDWYPAAQYRAYKADRAQESHRIIELFGKPALLVTYGAHDHAVMLPPDGGVFLELRGNMAGKEAFVDFVTRYVEKASVQQWLSALPPEMVTAGNAGSRLEQVLADIPVPPEFSRTRLAKDEALDPYQFRATVTGQVTCGWIAEYSKARSVHDPARQARAVAAMESSHHWKVLRQMDPEGDYPEVVWQYADGLAAGRVPSRAELRGALGC